MECSTILAEMQIPSEAEGVTEGSLYEALKKVKDGPAGAFAQKVTVWK